MIDEDDARRREFERQMQLAADRRAYYRIICRREDHSQPGDTEELGRLTKTLGLTAASIDDDLRIAREARKLVTLVDQWEKLNRARSRLYDLATRYPVFFDHRGKIPRLVN